MKRLLLLLFTLSLLLCAGCKKSSVTTPLTQADIDAIPVATADMTEAQLRQLVLDFFRLQLTFQWTPKESFEYTIVTYKEPRPFQAGTVYAGLPYQGNFNSGNLYLAMTYYDSSTGILDNTSMDGQTFSQTLGNHCTSSPYWAWSRVINSTLRYTNICMTESYGFLPVGDYEYNTSQWADTVKTKTVCKENGEQRMYECYGLLKPADGIFMFYSLGGNSHCRMVSSEPQVVRNADGTINAAESYLLFMDQGSSLKDYTAADGSTVQLQGKVDHKATFAELFEKGYLPFTFAEFLGTDPVEPAEVTLALPERVTSSQLATGAIRSNYPICYITATLTDESGKVVWETLVPSGNVDVKEMFLGKVLSLSEINAQAESGDCTLSVKAQISTGQLLTAYEGTLTK